MIEHQFKRVRRVIWLLSAIAFFGLIGLLFVEDRVPTGVRTIVYENEWVSGIEGWGPPQRVDFIPGNRARVNIDPVYLRVFMPRKFQSVDIVLWYKDPAKKLERIGSQLVSHRYDNWQFNLTPLTELEAEEDWQKSFASLSLANADFSDRAYRFILSAPGLNKEAEKVEIKQIQLRFQRDPLTWQKIKKYLFSN